MGLSGGIWVFWNTNLELEIIQMHPQLISFNVLQRWFDRWHLSILKLRKCLWNDLCSQKLNISSVWQTVGDFNYVLSVEETSSKEAFTDRCCINFIDWIF